MAKKDKISEELMRKEGEFLRIIGKNFNSETGNYELTIDIEASAELTWDVLMKICDRYGLICMPKKLYMLQKEMIDGICSFNNFNEDEEFESSAAIEGEKFLQ